MSAAAITSSLDPVRILIVEDDLRLAQLLVEYLSRHGFVVTEENDGERAFERMLREQPTLVILDLMLPGMNGFEVCRRARTRFSGGILILTADRSEADHAVGLDLGADDYVVKPVDPRILLARVRSLLRRMGRAPAKPTEADEIETTGITLKRSRREVRLGDRLVELTMMEFDLLWALAASAGEAVSRDELYRQVRNVAYDGVDRGLDVHVSRLRRKLEALGFDPALLKAVRGMGYLLVKR